MVWVIFVFHVASMVWSIVMQVLMHAGALPTPEGQHQFIQSLRSVDYVASYAIAALQLTGVIFLWLLRRQALPILTLGFILGTGNLVRNILKPTFFNMFANLGIAGLVGAAIGLIGGLALSAAIVAYTWYLRRRGVLQ